MFERHRYWQYLLMMAAVPALFLLADRLPMGQQLSLLLGKVLVVVQAPVQWVDDATLWLKQRQALQAELRIAHRQLIENASLTQQNQSLKEENRALRALLHITDIQGYQWRAVQVLGRSPEKKSQHLILQAQATQDAVVVASTGLVGLVDSSRDGIAVVRTILDGSVAVPVTLPQSSLAALVRGEGDHLSVDFVPLEDAPEVGDVLQTSGAGGLYPPGISVAYVTNIQPVAGRVFAHVEAVPTAHWQRESWLAIAARAESPLPSQP